MWVVREFAWSGTGRGWVYSKIFGGLRGEPNFAPGEMAERSIAAVLKTVEGNTSGGSNPSLSAHHTIEPASRAGFIHFRPCPVQDRCKMKPDIDMPGFSNYCFNLS